MVHNCEGLAVVHDRTRAPSLCSPLAILLPGVALFTVGYLVAATAALSTGPSQASRPPYLLPQTVKLQPGHGLSSRHILLCFQANHVRS
jgi:hypothetical protein